MLLYRHAQLVVRNLATHPHARRQENRLALAQAKRDVESGIKKLEVLKPRINKRYERYEQLIRDRDARKASSSTAKLFPPLDQNPSTKQSIHTRLPSDSVFSNGTETLAAGDNRDFAVKLAHKEIRRRASARKTTRQAGISEEEEQERRTAGLWGNWEEALAENDRGIDQETLRRQMQNVRLQVDGAVRGVSQNAGFRPPFEDQRFPYRYPSIPEHSAREPGIIPASPPYFLGDLSQRGSSLPPRPPPKNDEPLLYSEALPPRLGKDLDSSREIPSGSSTSSPTFQDLKPSGFTFKPSAYLENGTPLRTIFLPPNLRHRFLSLALPNTRANLETCGVLCGTLISNALFVSKLVIPEQESTSDTCETMNESGLFDYVDGEDLMVLGWIHTHPTQTCFMSSRDLHTHCGYQVMMPESIAIVCAPSKGECVVACDFDMPRLTL